MIRKSHSSSLFGIMQNIQVQICKFQLLKVLACRVNDGLAVKGTHVEWNTNTSIRLFFLHSAFKEVYEAHRHGVGERASSISLCMWVFE